MRDLDKRAALAVATLLGTWGIVASSGATIADLRRFCARKGMLYEFIFSASWVVVVSSSTFALASWVRTSLLKW